MPTFKSSAKNIIFLLVFIFSGAALAIIIDGLSTGTELTPFNTFIEAAVLHLRTPGLTVIMIGVTNIGSPFFLLCASVVLAAVLIFHQETYDVLLFMISMLVSMTALIVL